MGQLDSYVKRQAANNVDPNIVKYNLESAGWDPKTVEHVIWKYFSNERNVPHAGTPHVIRWLIVVVGIFVGVMLVLYMTILSPKPIDYDPTEPVIQQPVQDLTKDCPDIENAVLKDECYREKVAEGFDCSTLTDTIEKNFCFRAIDVTLSEKYS